MPIGGASSNPSTSLSTMDRVLDAAKRSCERWGFDRVTIDDIAAEAGISRATLYRMFPGGKDVLFEALRVRELEEFFTTLRDRIEGADTVEDLLVRASPRRSSLRWPSRSSTATRRSGSSTSSPASRSPTSSRRATPSISAMNRPPGRSSRRSSVQPSMKEPSHDRRPP